MSCQYFNIDYLTELFAVLIHKSMCTKGQFDSDGARSTRTYLLVKVPAGLGSHCLVNVLKCTLRLGPDYGFGQVFVPAMLFEKVRW